MIPMLTLTTSLWKAISTTTTDKDLYKDKSSLAIAWCIGSLCLLLVSHFLEKYVDNPAKKFSNDLVKLPITPVNTIVPESELAE